MALNRLGQMRTLSLGHKMCAPELWVMQSLQEQREVHVFPSADLRIWIHQEAQKNQYVRVRVFCCMCLRLCVQHV